MDRLPAADHLAALDRDIWVDEAPQGPAPEPGAEIMQMMREMAQVMGDMTRLLLDRMDQLEAKVAPPTEEPREDVAPQR